MFENFSLKILIFEQQPEAFFLEKELNSTFYGKKYRKLRIVTLVERNEQMKNNQEKAWNIFFQLNQSIWQSQKPSIFHAGSWQKLTAFQLS